MAQGNDDRPSLLPDPMAPAEFRDRRRQAFLTLQQYRLNDAWIVRSIPEFRETIDRLRSEGDLDPHGQRGTFRDLSRRLLLHYTAGEPIEKVSRRFDEMFSWFCKWHLDYPPYLTQLEKEFPPDDELGPVDMEATPLDFEELEAFHEVVTVLGLAVLLGKGTELRTTADLFKSMRGQDMLVEDLLSPAVTPVACKEFFHVKPYDPLIDAYFTAKSPEQASAYVKKYLEGWYKAMESCAWHNGHLLQQDYMTPYNGYWSFEAGAICLIHDIDDSSFRDHMVYPKDLVDWARANNSLGKIKAAAEAARRGGQPRLHCQSGEPCPRAGHWFTPARPDSRRLFAQGDMMPDVDGPWGLTIWQWDDRQ